MEDDPVTALAMRVEELAREVDEARQDLAAAKTVVAQSAARLQVEGIGPIVSMRNAVKQLGEKVDGLAAALAAALDQGKLKAPAAPDWDSLDQAERDAHLAALRDWVSGVLLVRYPEYTFPGCWEHHPTALWELGNLHAEWKRIYASPRGADLEAALWFHERWLPGTLGRLNKAINKGDGYCRDHGLGSHGQKATGW
jgi:outer membrane murein-binding lipoprotein Lpp